VFVAGLGTTGTLMGVGRYLKERKASVQIVAVEPPSGEIVQGLRSLEDGYVPPVFDPTVLDRKMLVRLGESIEFTRRLAQEHGIFGGISAGARDRGRREGGGPHDRGHHRGAARRRRVEVPVDRRVDGSHRRSGRARQSYDLLLR
jgi:[CysO sulfur-carrier protein]-thiocarboxylate-dependent cysteine synthase